MTQTPTDSLERAEELLRSGNKADARSLLIGYLEEHPDSAKGWWLMSYAVNGFDQQYDCLERVLELAPNHRKAQARLAALRGGALPAKSPFLRLKETPLSPPIITLILVLGCVGLMVVGYLGYRLFFPAQTSVSTQDGLAQISASSTTVAAEMNSLSSPTPSPVATQSLTPKVTKTPLISITPTFNPNATLTPIPESQVGNSVGQFPPDFTLINAVTNAEVNLHELIGKPMVIVFLNTLATECEPEMPGLQAVYEKYQDQGLVILGIGVGSSQSALRNYTGRFGGLSFPLLSDWEHTIAGLYEVETVPTNIFVRKNGKIWQISSTVLSETDLDTAIASLLKVP